MFVIAGVWTLVGAIGKILVDAPCNFHHTPIMFLDSLINHVRCRGEGVCRWPQDLKVWAQNVAKCKREEKYMWPLGVMFINKWSCWWWNQSIMAPKPHYSQWGKKCSDPSLNKSTSVSVAKCSLSIKVKVLILSHGHNMIYYHIWYKFLKLFITKWSGNWRIF